MQKPYLAPIPRTQRTVDRFPGLDRREGASPGCTADEKNLSGRLYPLLAPRLPRSVLPGCSNVTALAVKDAVCTVRGSSLYVNELEVSGVTLSAVNVPRQLVGMGAYLIVWPDGVYVNTADLTDCGTLAQTNTAQGTVTYAPCDSRGNEWDLSDAVMADSSPADPADGDTWIDTSSDAHALYVARGGEWTSVAQVYVKLTAQGIGAGLRVYDGVTVSGAAAPGAAYGIARQIDSLNASGNHVYAAGTDYVVIAGMLDAAVAVHDATVTVSRPVPPMKYLCECGNRLWGCWYGPSGGETVNEIYGSALGDPRVWCRYLGGSTDSYRVSVGSDGPFTAIASHLGNVLAFKQDRLHRLYGTQPSNYCLTETLCEGVQDGSAFSITAINGVLYYKGPRRVMAYDGGVPYPVSDALGDATYTDARAGHFGDVLYLCMRSPAGAYELYTCDTRRHAWHREDDVQASYFSQKNDSLLFVDAQGRVIDALGRFPGSVPEDAPLFRALFPPDGYDSPDRKYLSLYRVRARLPRGSLLRVLIEYDSSGRFEPQAVIRGSGKTDVVFIPVRPKRCDHAALTIEGQGDCAIYSVTRIRS